MDFGVVSHKQAFPNAVCMGSAELRDERGRGSVNLKHQRSGLVEDCWKSHKMLKPGEVDFSSKIVSDSLAAFGRSNLWPPDDGGQKMLSFSSPSPHGGGGLGDGGRSIAFSMDESNSGNGGSGGIRGSFSRLRGPFTPSQWMELEHQALIYKHIVANVPVPSNLLVPLKRSLYSYGSPYASNLWWGPFHLGFSGNNDPEPGRCRRTDGKKWRCSRDAVPDQKYCERHINRGRHRSRKPVEGQTGHASKVASVAHSGSNASNSLSSIQHPLQPNAAIASTDHFVSRSQGFQGLSLIPPTRNHKSKDAPFQESSNSGFGIVFSDCLLNPSGKISYMNATSSDSFNTKGANTQHPVHHFIDDWPKDQSDRPSPSWPEELKSDWTQLSMSIPDFSSSSNSPPLEKSTLSTLSLGVSGQPVEKQPSWAPVVWGNSMGGPLGEVLTSTSSPILGSSPTGVLQKSTLSNSSSGGSLTSGDNKKAAESVSLCNDLLGSALVHSATIPSL